MCGICGVYNFDDLGEVDQLLLKAICDLMAHRGPDDEGYFCSGPIGLGHRRLSIIDLQTGKQPIFNEDHSCAIVLNGEIYNYRQLRGDLIKKGHSFKTKSDTEVVIHLYEELGPACLEELRGMFAFAIWDGLKGSLMLARDRVGKKPLLYAMLPGSLVFASEARAILAHPGVERSVDLGALDLYLTLGYIPSPLTIFSQIKKLPPAHYLICRGGQLSLKRYWELRYTPKARFISEDECCDRLKEIFEEATRLRLVSDVPLGALLSGGVDSGATVATMSRLMDGAVKTFSIGFQDDEYDELPYARLIAKKFGTDHHEFIVKPDAVDILPKLIWHYSEPFADASAVPCYYVSRMARGYVTVALTGDGGDESFAGYDRYRAASLARYYSVLPKALRSRVIKPALWALPGGGSRWSFLAMARRFVNCADADPFTTYVSLIAYFEPEMKNDLYTADLKAALQRTGGDFSMREKFYHDAPANLLEKALSLDSSIYLPDDLLVKMDIASMANSLEVRSPFLDHRLMEFAASLPSHLKLNRMRQKYILKKAFSRILPEQILKRRKMGFGVPVGKWIKSELKDMVYGLLLSEKCIGRGYFRRDALERLIGDHISGAADHGQRLWALAVLELWHRTFIDGAPSRKS